MCGICGIIDLTGGSRAASLTTTVEAMATRLTHRGPDSHGTWHDSETGVAFGHRRLAIIDLSETGHQPMTSRDGRYVLCYNGEIYNYQELKHDLQDEGCVFVGESDTEVVLEACSHWGPAATLQRLNGMFAYGLWDRDTKVLHLARDRLGEKPLYYGWVGKIFLFGSDLDALAAHPAFRPALDTESLAQYLRYCYVPAPRTIYTGIYKLPPARSVAITASEAGALPPPALYWRADQIAVEGQQSPFEGDVISATDVLDELLGDAVKRRMVSDVPVGALLSGGIDSSTVVALMQKHNSRPVNTYSIGYEEAGYDESQSARLVAEHLGTRHTGVMISSKDAVEVIPELPNLYHEPFADSSQIPTYLLSKLARSEVTVSLSGDGGDELFGGYNRHYWVPAVHRLMSRTPRVLHRGLASGLRGLSPATWDRLFRMVRWLHPARWAIRTPGDKFHKLADLMESPSVVEAYRRLSSSWQSPADVVRGISAASTNLPGDGGCPELADHAHRLMYMDLTTYLPDDLLVKVDRASMGVSLEVRPPLLDHRVVEFAWRLPLSMKIRDRQGKFLLRQLLYRYVPRGLVDRPKMGFAVLMDRWLRGPLRDWASDLLSPDLLSRQRVLNPDLITQTWREHLSGRRNWHSQLWTVLMFQCWLQTHPSLVP